MFQFYRQCLIRRPFLTNAVTSSLILAAGDSLAQSIERRKYRELHHSTDIDNHPAMQWQPSRTVILAVWGGLGFSPFFTRLFQYLDSLPALTAKTPRNIAIRVVSIWIVAMPLNAAFFIHTSTLEYFFPVKRFSAQDFVTTDKFDQNTKIIIPNTAITKAIHQSNHTNDKSNTAILAPSAYDIISARVIDQWKTQLPSVITNAALVWIPWNVVNMTVVPPHYRVAASSILSVIWNTWSVILIRCFMNYQF